MDGALELFHYLDFPNQVKNGKEYPINWIKISGDKKEDYEYEIRI